MDLGSKKISFGFSKVSKNSSAKVKNRTDNEKIEYVVCLDSKTLVCKGDVGVIKEEEVGLVIPLNRSSNLKTDKITSVEKKNVVPGKVIPQECHAETATGMEDTLEEMAAKEILIDAKKVSESTDDSKKKNLIIQKSQTSSAGSKESTLDDYDSIPIGDFGMAMLRGMGWQPGTGTNKSGMISTLSLPQVRPRGVGLGADKTYHLTPQKHISNEEELKLAKGSYVQIILGTWKGQYGQIEGFMSEDSGRILIKLAMQSSTVSINEMAIKPVTKKEYDKNSRVLNVSKYEEYKQKSEIKQSECPIKPHTEDRHSSPDTTDKCESKTYCKQKAERRSEESSDDDKRMHCSDSEDRYSVDREEHRNYRNVEDNRLEKKERKSRNNESSDDSQSNRHKGSRSSKDRSDKSRKHKKDRESRDRSHKIDRRHKKRDKRSKNRSEDNYRRRRHSRD